MAGEAMKIAEQLQTVTRVFLDTTPVIYYVEANPRYRPIVEVIFDRLDNWGADRRHLAGDFSRVSCISVSPWPVTNRTRFCGLNRQWQQLRAARLIEAGWDKLLHTFNEISDCFKNFMASMLFTLPEKESEKYEWRYVD
jgi:hypothetical protein